ncbi:hypothetical protein M9435_002065 [Picochlorum sp. BPE23]|nr:hypothetical protein M9435_002065 [Picochlorum sp. BPE23]
MGALNGHGVRCSPQPWTTSRNTPGLPVSIKHHNAVSGTLDWRLRRMDAPSVRITHRPSCSCTSSCGPEGLSTQDVPAWSECIDILVDIGMTNDSAEKAMVRGFGWGSQAYWRQELVREPPSAQAVHACLEYLTISLGMDSNADKVKVLEKFPEVLKVDQTLMEENVGKLKKNYFLKGTALTKSIVRKPKVLGATTDCQGDCAGECTRCFAQF